MSKRFCKLFGFSLLCLWLIFFKKRQRIRSKKDDDDDDDDNQCKPEAKNIFGSLHNDTHSLFLSLAHQIANDKNHLLLMHISF